MKIGKPQIITKDDKSIYQVYIESPTGAETLWYSLDQSFGDLLVDANDGPLVALLIPAMEMGEDIHIGGIISDRLYYNLQGPLQKLLQHIIPSLHQIKIYPENIQCTQASNVSGVATGFSGGIDSFSVLADYYYSTIPEHLKITHLLYNNVGSHGTGGEKLFRKRYEHLLPTTERIGLPFIMINSNLDTFYNNKLGFQQTHTLRNASVTLLLQGGISRYLYASSYDYSRVFVGVTHDTAYSESIILPLLSTDIINISSVGSEHTRVQKTLSIAELPDSYDTLDVCVNADNNNGYTNCSTCWKCLRTLTTLEIAGYLERYSNSFDINAYKHKRNKYFTTLLEGHGTGMTEVVDFAKERHYPFPISSQLMHYSGVSPMMSVSWRTLRKLKHLMVRSD